MLNEYRNVLALSLTSHPKHHYLNQLHAQDHVVVVEHRLLKVVTAACESNSSKYFTLQQQKKDFG